MEHHIRNMRKHKFCFGYAKWVEIYTVALDIRYLLDNSEMGHRHFNLEEIQTNERKATDIKVVVLPTSVQNVVFF